MTFSNFSTFFRFFSPMLKCKQLIKGGKKVIKKGFKSYRRLGQ